MTDLKRPSDYLKKGWTQETLAKNADGSYTDPDDSAESYCLLGSIFAAMTDPEDYTVRVKLQTALHDVLIERYDVLDPPEGMGIISAMNDYAIQTQEEAVARMLEAEEASGLWDA